MVVLTCHPGPHRLVLQRPLASCQLFPQNHTAIGGLCILGLRICLFRSLCICMRSEIAWNLWSSVDAPQRRGMAYLFDPSLHVWQNELRVITSEWIFTDDGSIDAAW